MRLEACLALIVLLLSAMSTTRQVAGASANNDGLHVSAFKVPTAELTSQENYNIVKLKINDALDEVSQEEGNRPLYVLVFADEEERGTTRFIQWAGWNIVTTYSYDAWAKLHVERGDEALIANFDIDVRILGFLDWDSDDKSTSMYNIWSELLLENGGYIGQWYDGAYWSNYVDAIIGITKQDTPDTPEIFGLSSGAGLLDEHVSAILLKWTNYYIWEDNLAQHEICHLFYADDHRLGYADGCCAMTYLHSHFQTFFMKTEPSGRFSHTCHVL